MSKKVINGLILLQILTDVVLVTEYNQNWCGTIPLLESFYSQQQNIVSRRLGFAIVNEQFPMDVLAEDRQ